MQFDQLSRRKFITLLSGTTVVWPLATRAQQSVMPEIGFLHLTSRDETRGYLPDFHKGLADVGYIEGKNVAIEYRWGEGHNDRLPSLIAELVRRQVSVIVTLESTLAALAAKEATRTIPVIFMQGADPVRVGLVGQSLRARARRRPSVTISHHWASEYRARPFGCTFRPTVQVLDDL
jgi:putative ABC transport system substrate-binding protein